MAMIATALSVTAPHFHPPLTLHDYRKICREQGQQFPPVAVPGERQIRRKNAAMNLNRRQPTRPYSTDPLLPHFWSYPVTPQQQHQQQGFGSIHESSSSAESPNFLAYQFRGLPSVRDQRQHEYRQSASADGYQIERSDVDEDEELVRAQSVPIRNARALSLRPHKRLPRPAHFERDLEDLLGLHERVTTLSSDSPTDTSTQVSITRFPQPPSRLPASHDPVHRDLPPSGVEKAPTQTVLHVRGISFDLINPHDSLRLQDIETPAERDETLDYFHPEHLPTHASLPATVSMDLMQHSPDPDGEVKYAPTPPRAIFPSLEAAYNSILKGQDIAKGPSPLEQVQSTDPDLSFEDPRPIELVRPPPTGTVPFSASSPSLSLGRRISRAFHRKNKSSDATIRPRLASFASRQLEHSETEPLLPSYSGAIHAENNIQSTLNVQQVDPGVQDPPVGGHNIPSYSPDNVRRRTALLLRSSSLRSPTNLINQHTRQAFTQPANDMNSSDLEALDLVFAAPSTRILLGRSGMSSAPTSQADSTIGSIIERYNRPADVSNSEGQLSRESLLNQTVLAQNAAFMESMRSLKPTSSGLSQFEFGFDRSTQTPQSYSKDPVDSEAHDRNGVDHSDGDEEASKEHGQHQSGRPHTGTIRALGRAPGAAPSASLPPEPSFQTRSSALGFLKRSYVSDPDVGSCETSYGDTRHLLFPSQEFSTPELGRSHSQDNLSDILFDETPIYAAAEFPPADLAISSAKEHDSLSKDDEEISETSIKLNESDPDDIDTQIENDLKHLSVLSGLSNLSGSIFVVDRAEVIHYSDNQEPRESCGTEAFLGSTNEHSRSQNSFQTVEAPLKTPERLPFAAFSQKSVRPGLYRLSHAERHSIISGISSPDNASPELPEAIDVFHDTEANDWETIPESRHGVSSNPAGNISLAELTSHDSFGTLNNIDFYPGNPKYQHSYRLQMLRQESDCARILPSYDYADGVGFPNRNARTPPASALYTYTSPTLSNAQKHQSNHLREQFGRSLTPDGAVSATPGPGSADQTLRSNFSPFIWARANLSVVHEGATETSSRAATQGVLSRSTSRLIDVTTTPRSNGLRPSSPTWWTSQNTLSSSIDVEQGSELTQDRTASDHAPLSSNTRMHVVGQLRQGDPRMASSPLDQNNSFAKLTYLGPLANITGTPNGTGMRVVGSSLVGSSSPAVPIINTPSTGSRYLTQTPPSSPPYVQRSIPLAQDANSPLARYDERHYSTKPKRLSKRDRSSYSANARAAEYIRPYVTGQSKHFEMRLISLEKPASATMKSPTHPAFESGYAKRGISNHPSRPLLPLAGQDLTLTDYLDQDHPRLLRLDRVPSSIATSTRSRKQFLSWVTLIIVLVFPPLTLLYGLSRLDVAMFSYTHGQIEHFGKRQKKIALFGIPLSLAIWVLVVLLATGI